MGAAAADTRDPPPVKITGDAPAKVINPAQLRQLGETLTKTFDQYASDRLLAELKWLRNLRQYLGVYDPEIEKQLSPNRSKAYPRITRVKCISVLSRIMNLMFPGNERNWSLQASPSPDMSPEDVKQAIMTAQKAAAGPDGQPPQLDDDFVMAAVQALATSRAEALSTLIDDQLEEIGGDQTVDYIQLNRKVVKSGILYGLGVLRGPFVREVTGTRWSIDPATGSPVVKSSTTYKPQFEFVPVWDYYPDMSAKTMASMDGYFQRIVMTRSQVLALAKRSDFFGDVIKDFLKENPQGNYKARSYEQDLRAIGVKQNVSDIKPNTQKYEILVWHGPISAETLVSVGVDIPKEKRADEIDAEVWMVGNMVIKADMNPWAKLGIDVKTVHTFLFDEDDTSPVGNGLPNVMRDSQMSISAASRMLLDNAGVVCGPNIELNTELMRPDQDLSSISSYKIWYREGTGADAQFPAIRNIQIDAHMDELLKVIELFMKFADAETFVGPATGGDMEKNPSEPMRTAAGASMMRGDAALPFKDIIRNFDSFTQSVLTALVYFNKKFNPTKAPAGDYNIIARGATSLIAKEVRGMQIDALSATLRPEEQDHVDARKLVEAKFASRDLKDMLVSPDEAKRRQDAKAEAQQKLDATQAEMSAAMVRKTLADAFKGISQGQKNTAMADAQTVTAALNVLEKGLTLENPSEASGSGAQ